MLMFIQSIGAPSGVFSFSTVKWISSAAARAKYLASLPGHIIAAAWLCAAFSNSSLAVQF
jgi:hypothetical protein